MSEAQRLTFALKGRWFGSYGQAFCPAHENTRSPALTLADGEDGRLLAKCHSGCDFRDVAAALRRAGLIEGRAPSSGPAGPRRAAPNANALIERARRARYASEIWRDALPIAGTPAEAYLRSRGITCDLPPTLRYATACKVPGSGTPLPALVARVDGSPAFAVHRTYVRSDGTGKATVTPSKAMLGECRGGGVHLSTCSYTRDELPLVVCEGIENGLSLLSGFLNEPARVVAALSTSGVGGFVLPRTPGKLVVASDNDPAGRGAAAKLMERAARLGWRVFDMTPPDSRDWNDLLRAGVCQV